MQFFLPGLGQLRHVEPPTHESAFDVSGKRAVQVDKGPIVYAVGSLARSFSRVTLRYFELIAIPPVVCEKKSEICER